MHNIVFQSRRVARTYVGGFDWLVSYAVVISPFELSVDRPNMTELVTRETELVIV